MESMTTEQKSSKRRDTDSSFTFKKLHSIVQKLRGPETLIPELLELLPSMGLEPETLHLPAQFPKGWGSTILI